MVAGVSLGFREGHGSERKNREFVAKFGDRPVGVASGQAGSVSSGAARGRGTMGNLSLACLEPSAKRSRCRRVCPRSFAKASLS